MDFNLINFIGILIGSVGVVGYRYMPQGWHLLMWIPITIGYALYFGK